MSCTGGGRRKRSGDGQEGVAVRKEWQSGRSGSQKEVAVRKEWKSERSGSQKGVEVRKEWKSERSGSQKGVEVKKGGTIDKEVKSIILLSVNTTVPGREVLQFLPHIPLTRDAGKEGQMHTATERAEEEYSSD
jgi:hypothetical protein